MRLTVVIPAFNEEHRLPATLARCAAFLAARPELCPAELVVVDDGSRDATARVVEEFSGPPTVAVHLVRLDTNRGKGAAVRAGLAASRGARVLISDADLATPIEELDVLLAHPAGVVLGSRALRRELIARRQPLPRDLLGRVFNVALRALRLTRFADTQCGFKLLDGEVARRLAGALRLDGFAFDVELLARAERAGVTVEEVPVRWSHMEASRVHPLRHGLRMACDAVRVRLWLWRGR
jgi:dolichyl-phosphate beta-glucosyltransferase